MLDESICHFRGVWFISSLLFYFSFQALRRIPGMNFASSTRAAEDRIKWKGIVAKSVLCGAPGKVVG